MKLAVVGLAVILVSCQEEVDPILQKKYEEQEVLISTSRNELESLQRAILEKEATDHTVELKEVKAALAAASAERLELENKVRELEASAVDAQKSLEKYKGQYPIKNQ